MTRADAARLGGLARARSLPPGRRREIARQGFAALVARRFRGDRQAAIDWITAKGRASQDPCPWNHAWPEPGPMPDPRPREEHP